MCMYCNIGTCDLLHPVSFAFPGFAPIRRHVIAASKSPGHKRPELALSTSFLLPPSLHLPCLALIATLFLLFPPPIDHRALAFCSTHCPFTLPDMAQSDPKVVSS